MSPAEVIALAALVGWVLITADRSRAWPSELRLASTSGDPPSVGKDSLAVIVPARNEAELLPRTLASLLAQSIEGGRIYLVDDGSTDDTADLAKRLGAEVTSSMRLRVVDAGPKPAGWTGKVHALEQGYRAILDEANRSGEPLPDWLLLTDADIHHRPGSFASLLDQAEIDGRDDRFDLVSIMARLQARCFWERLIIPSFVFFFQLLYPFRGVQDPESSVAAAAGGCMLLRRSALESAGGLRVIADAVIDDVALASAIQRIGGRTWLGFDDGIRSLRSYPRLADLWQMVSRTAFTQLRYSAILLALTLVALTVFVVSPPVTMGWAATGLAASADGLDDLRIRVLVWSAASWILMSLALLPAVRYHRVPPIYAANLPVAGVLFGLMTLSSAWNHWRGRGVVWRDRHHRIR